MHCKAAASLSAEVENYMGKANEQADWASLHDARGCMRLTGGFSFCAGEAGAWHLP